MTLSTPRAIVISVIALLLCISSLYLPHTEQAQAEELDALQTAVEETAQQYNQSVDTVASLEQQIEDNEARIAEIEASLPAQQEECDEAVKTLYMFQQSGSSLLNLIFKAQNFTEFTNSIDYLNRITSTSLATIQKTRDLKDELEKTKEDLISAKNQAEAEQEKAATALADAQAAREAAMQQAVEEAAAQAAEQTAAQAAAQTTAGASVSVPSVSSDDVQWSTPKEEFVSTWAARIDAYLAGSPLAGQGQTFAAAAWDYGVDPRWSPAISFTESSKGAACARPYNAWGWGTKSWTSWEEAINAHVSGLARLYGSTITYEAAQKYCPSSPDSWYNTTFAQMQMI